jgi:hypothetical protein
MTKPPLQNARNSKAEQNGLQPRRGQKGQNLSCAESGFRRRLAGHFERPTMGVQIDEIDCTEFRTNSGLTQKNLQAGLAQATESSRRLTACD